MVTVPAAPLLNAGDMNKTYVPMYAFNAIVKESFFRKNGVFPRSATSDTVA